MNYIGSKLKLSNFLIETITNTCHNNNDTLQNMTFCDLFAGTGIVGRTFNPLVKKVISNDLEYYSYVINQAYLTNDIETLQSQDLEEIILHLNNMPLTSKGFIYNNYCMGSGSNRQYFTDYNGKKIDTIRLEIEKLYTTETIEEEMYFFLLASLLESADKIANTTSVYGAFLKHIKSAALKEIVFHPILLNKNNNSNINKVFNCNSNDLITAISGDILYLDPPYNQREYGANYHLLNTIAKYDTFIPKGVTGLREYNISQYCKKNQVLNAFEELIKKANFKYIFLSYNNEGLMSQEETKNIMSKYGTYDLAIQKYQRYKADKTESRVHTANSTFEFLHILKKDH